MTALPCSGAWLSGMPLPARDCAADQSAGLWLHHHCRPLPRPLGGGVVLQGAQAEPQGEKFRGHQRERVAYPDLDSPDCHAAAEVATSPLESQMVAVEPGFHAAAESVYLSRSTDVAG